MKKLFEKEKEGFMYRIRENTTEAYIKEGYERINDASMIAPILGDFLRKNKINTMSNLMRVSEKAWDKHMVVLKSDDFVFEMEEPIYNRYREEIDQILENNMKEAVNKYLSDGKTRILVNFTTSGLEYEKNEENKSETISGLKELYISYTNPLDINLFKNIVLNVIGNDDASVSFLNSTDILLKSGNRSLVLDKSAYELTNDIIKEHKNLNKNM